VPRLVEARAWTGLAMEYRVVVGALGAFYVEGLDPQDSASLSPFNTKYSKETPIMYFTDYYDHNKKKIWEGDIVQCSKNKYYREVVWFGGTYWLINPDRKQDFPISVVNSSHTNTVIVGNIFENPELLYGSQIN
jgi:YopX protein